MGYTADSIALSFLRSTMSLCIETLVSPGTLDAIRSKALDSIAKADSLSALKHSLVNTITELAHTVLITPKGPLSPYVNQLLEIITEEYTDSSLGLKLVADRLFVNATYLGRQFKIETGFYFNDYLARIRIRQAEILLVSTDYMVADVASKVGFSSVNYFCQVFKKITSLTPSDVRDASITFQE